MGKGLQRTVLTVLFLVGLAVFSYPYAQGLLVKREMESTVQTFQEQKETQPTTSVVISDSTQPSEQRLYPELWEDMTAYNEEIFKQGQSGLSCNHDTDHIHEAGGLSASQPSPAPGTTDSPWEVRIDAPQIPDAEPERDLHEPFDHGSAPQSPDGDRGDSPEPGGEHRQPDGTDRGRDGGTESRRPDEVGGSDEQLPSSSGGAGADGTDLRIDGIIPPPSFEEQAGYELLSGYPGWIYQARRKKHL